jgi:hypothetical protein
MYCHTSTDMPNEAPNESATVPTMTSAATRLGVTFIPYAHAQSGIRDELTSRTLAMVDALRSSYKREVLRQAKYWGLDDAV